MQTKLYRQQHGEIRRLLGDIQQTLNPTDAEKGRSGLAQLAGVLKIHLAMEDNALYPRMLAHDDAAVRATAAEYQESMGHLAPAFEQFYEKWRRHGAIEADSSEFARSYRALALALEDRMRMEDANLYDLVDRKLELVS